MKYLSVCSGIEAVSVAVKKCAKCGDAKPLDEFHRHKGGSQGRHSWCKACCRIYYRANRKRNYSAEQKRRWLVKGRYGLTANEVRALHRAQAGLCGLCETSIDGRYCIDHDHITGKVRGLLCHRCNVLIGGMDDPAFRAKAMAWMERGR